MATTATPVSPAQGSTAPDRLEKALAFLSLALLATVLTALVRGQGDWGQVPALVWGHLGLILVALALTPLMLLRPRGDGLHRTLGTIWFLAMFCAAVSSFGITRNGHFSPIHLLSIFVVIMVPISWRAARGHRVARHRRVVRGLVIGALLVAGVFTFPFDRLLGHWLFG
ncbi:DUF2306 domain-containing protein [Novosphingobium sp. PS1R-30]|uniref:DUF2306 domain-containing protein n=1 Tax=Novosphingobium anseongense TaxID=3133436 RepID=A0ABU8S222_9SPHN